MICVEGYKAFYGIMRISPINPEYQGYKMDGNWLYKPEHDCWYCNGRSFPASVCKVVKDNTERRD